MQLEFVKLREDAMIPTRGSVGAAGNDLYACLEKDLVIQAGETKKVATGLAIKIPNGYFGGIFPRSGIATKEGIRLANCVGVCDEDYRGEYIVPLHNDSKEPRIIKSGQKIAQLIVLPYMGVEFEEVEELDNTKRGNEGFGSTGK